MSLLAKIGVLVLGLMFVNGFAEGADTTDRRSDSQKTFDQNMQNAKEVSKRKQEEKRKEDMRDKSHDGRVKVGKDTSIGGSANPPSVDIKRTTP